MLEQFEEIPKSIFDYNFNPVNEIVRESDILTQYTHMSYVSYGSNIMLFGFLIWEIWFKHSELLLDSFQEQNLELCPIFENFLEMIET